MGLADLLGSGGMGAAEHVMAFTGERQKVLANNMANIDTPGYRMRDLDIRRFERTLASALERGRLVNPNLPRLDLPDARGLDSNSPGSRRHGDDLRGLVFHDDNDRSVEKLVSKMTFNNSQQNQAVSMLRSQVRLLRSIIAEDAT